jgi:YesN/AraC family two-component response regulator
MCKQHQKIDLLVTDLILPHIDGTKLAEAVTMNRPEMRGLFMSGYAPESFSQRHVKLPGGLFLGKPFSPVMLAD